MKRTLIVLGLALCALPARGDDPPSSELDALTLIDEVPTKDEISRMFLDPIPRLRELATTLTVDPGVQLRAIRALPLFCLPSCKQIANDPPHPARAAVLAVIDEVKEARSGRSILKLRAGVEALGLTRSGAQSDVDLLVRFLNHPTSRDVRATAARALGNLCHPAAIAPLEERLTSESKAQVKRAIQTALGDLDTCSPP